MFFEGSEKKVEISLRDGLPSLRDRGEDYWNEVVRACEAQVLSKISNEVLTAYLLSESSLFVYDRHLIMITCGRTQLIKAVEKLVEDFGAENLEVLVYERKHEVFPREQPSHFIDDIASLQKMVSGRAFRLGNEDEHHLFLYHLQSDYNPPSDDVTLEVLMHGVTGEVQTLFSAAPGRDRAQICEKIGVREILPGFKVDDHFFDPQGYSLNAIKDDSYFTIHVTPQEIGSYVSFETNYNYLEKNELMAILKRALSIFRPSSFDLVTFEPTQVAQKKDFQFDGYGNRRRVVETLNCGYQVGFLTYFLQEAGEKPAYEIEMKGVEKE